VANRIEIEVEVEQTGTGMEGVRQRLAASARAAGQDIESAFDRSAASASSAFDGMAGRIGSAFNRVTGEARGLWDRIGADARQGGARAGTQGGDSFADSLRDGLKNVDFRSIGGNIASGLDALGSMGGPIAAAAVAVGMAIGEDVASGFTRGFEANKRGLALQIQTGLTAIDTGPIGRSAGEAYSSGFGESLEGLSRSAAILDNVLSDIDPSTPLVDATRWASTLSEHFSVDIPRSAELAGRMIHQGLADNTEQAYDVMIGAAQRYQASYDEILDVTREFGTTFSELGISGAQAADFIGQAWSQGLVPTIDRAGELFEEFVIEVETGVKGRAAPALAAMGLDITKVQDALADGRGKEAIQILAAELLKIEDIAYRNELAVQIFGAAIESASDKQAVLELIASIDDLGTEFDGAAENAARMAEQMQTDMDVLKRDVEDLASSAGSNFAEFYNQMRGLGSDPWGEIKRDIEEVANLFDGQLKGSATGTLDALREGLESTGQTLGHMAYEGEQDLGELELGLDDASDAVADLDTQFAELQSRFDGDAALRKVYEDLDQLSQSSFQATSDIYDTGTGFDQTTAKGREYSSQLENLHGDLMDLAAGHRDGTVTANQLTSAQIAVQAQLRSVAQQLGLTAAETQDLINRYGQVPANVTTQIDLKGDAFDKTRELIARLRGLDGYRATSYVNTINTTRYVTSRGGGNTYFASGGPVHAAQAGGLGAPVIVNDGAGVEAARMPAGDLVMLPHGANVISHEDTERMALTGELGTGGPTINVHLTVQGSVVTERDLVGRIADALRRGGIDGYGRR
jgi:hypothetical protein